MQVANDPHRFRVVCAGRRSGKSYLAQRIVLKWAVESPGIYWIVSPTYKQSKQIHWRDLQAAIPRNWVVKKNEVDLSITLANGSVIELKGAENPDALRGVKLRGLVVDEIASIRNWDWLWLEVLRPTLTDYQAPALFISTPKGFNHFYELYQMGQTVGGVESGSQHYRSWRFTSYENPHVAKEELDQQRNELTEDTFAQEYLADFRKHTGLVYKQFDRSLHVIEPFEIPDSWLVYRALDFGSTNPTVCLWIAVDPDDNWYIAGEHYASGQTIETHAESISQHPLSTRVEASYGDPSGAQWIYEFAGRGIDILPATKETGTTFNTWVRYKIEKIAEKLKPIPGHTVPVLPKGVSQLTTGCPSLFVFSTATNTIREFETYRWKEKSVTQAQDLNEPDVPEKANDHAMDALSYFASSYIADHEERVEKPWDGKVPGTYIRPSVEEDENAWGAEVEFNDWEVAA